jgi:hypothetical protein
MSFFPGWPPFPISLLLSKFPSHPGSEIGGHCPTPDPGVDIILSTVTVGFIPPPEGTCGFSFSCRHRIFKILDELSYGFT